MGRFVRMGCQIRRKLGCETCLGRVRLEELDRVARLELRGREELWVPAETPARRKLDLGLQEVQHVSRIDQQLQRVCRNAIAQLVLRFVGDDGVGEVTHGAIARLLGLLVPIILLAVQKRRRHAHLFGELQLPWRVDDQVLSRLERLEPADGLVADLQENAVGDVCRGNGQWHEQARR